MNRARSLATTLLLTSVLLGAASPVFAQETADLSDAVLPVELHWEATKERTLVNPPYDIPPPPDGVTIDGTLLIVAVCGVADCGYVSSIDLWPQTPVGEVPHVGWVQTGTTWTLDGQGHFVSSSYPDGTTCVYRHTEAWDVEVVEAVFDGTALVATRLEGSFVRGDVLDPAASTPGDVECPPYEAVDVWSVVAIADVEAAPVVDPTDPEPGPASTPEPVAIAAEEPQPGGEFPWPILVLIAVLVAITGGGYVLLANGRGNGQGPAGQEAAEDDDDDPVDIAEMVVGEEVEDPCPHLIYITGDDRFEIDQNTIDRVNAESLEELRAYCENTMRQLQEAAPDQLDMDETLRDLASRNPELKESFERLFNAPRRGDPDPMTVRQAITGLKDRLDRMADNIPPTIPGVTQPVEGPIQLQVELINGGPADHAGTAHVSVRDSIRGGLNEPSGRVIDPLVVGGRKVRVEGWREDAQTGSADVVWGSELTFGIAGSLRGNYGDLDIIVEYRCRHGRIATKHFKVRVRGVYEETLIHEARREYERGLDHIESTDEWIRGLMALVRIVAEAIDWAGDAWKTWAPNIIAFSADSVEGFLSIATEVVDATWAIDEAIWRHRYQTARDASFRRAEMLPEGAPERGDRELRDFSDAGRPR